MTFLVLQICLLKITIRGLTFIASHKMDDLVRDDTYTCPSLDDTGLLDQMVTLVGVPRQERLRTMSKKKGTIFDAKSGCTGITIEKSDRRFFRASIAIAVKLEEQGHGRSFLT
jgi:hypothetical protein